MAKQQSIHNKTMKKIIKLAAAFAVSGAMLATVGCQQIYEDIDDINAEIEQIEKTDLVTLKGRIETCIAEIERVEAAYKTDDAALKAEIEEAYKQADRELLQSATTLATNLKKEYDGKIEELTTQLTNAVKDLATQANLSAFSNSVDTAKANLRAADAKLAAEIIAALQTCADARALLKSEVTTALNDSTAKYALIIAGIQSEVADKYSELLGKINAQNAELNSVKDELAVLAVADSTNAADLKAAKTQLEQAVQDAKTELQTAIDNAVAGIDPRVDSLAGVTLQIVNDLAQLKILVKDFETAVYAKIKADSTSTNGKIDAIKTDYLAKYAELAGIDEDIQHTLDSLKGVYDTKIGNLDAKDGELNTAITNLRTEYEGKVNEFELELKKLNSADSAAKVRIDTLVAGVYARISAVNDALRDSIAKTLVDAKAYTDAQIAALKLDEKLAGVKSEFADSIKAIREDYIKQVDVVDAKYKEIVDKLVAKIQSIVAVPSAQYQIVSFTFNNMPAGPEKIRASFEVLPKEAVEKITSANAQLHVRMALSPYDQQLNYAGSRVPMLVKDTVLTGSALDSVVVDKAAGVVTIVAALDTQKDEDGKTVFADNGQKIYFSLGVSDFSATYNEVQSEYVAATAKSCKLENSCKWYVADTLYILNNDAVVDTAANKHCYNEGAKNFGIEATLKFDASFADGATSKNVKELGEYLGDSLYVTYSVAGNTSGSGASMKQIKVALQDSTDATYAAKFKAVPDTSKSANTSIAAYEITVTPTLMSKNQGTIKDLPVWKANYEVTKFEHNATYNLTNDWALRKGTNQTDSIVFAIANADSAYFVANDIAAKTPSKKTNHALNNGTSMKIAKSLADNSKLKFQYITANFDTVAVKDTVVIPYDNGTNYGKVTLAITSGAAPVFRGSDSIEDFKFVKAEGGVGDTVKLSFNKVVPYFEGKADSTWTGFPANHDSLLFIGFAMNGKPKSPYSNKLKDTLKVVQLKGQPNIAGAYVAKPLNYGRTYIDTLRLSAGSTKVAKMFYEFPFSFKTVDCPFKVINTQTVDSLSFTGKLKSGDTLKFHHDSINVAEFYKIVWSADSSDYNGTETVTVDVTCGKETKNVVSTSNKSTLKPLYFQKDSLLKYKTVFASTVYRSSIKNEEKCESKKFVEKSPITAFTIKDSIKVVRTQTKADTIRIDGANGYVIKIEASDITLDNAWDSLVWKAQGEDFFGALKFIDNTDVLLKVSDRVVTLDGIKQNVNGFEMKLDPATQKPVLVIDEDAQKADYQISVPYVAHKYMGTEEIAGTLVLRFTKE